MAWVRFDDGFFRHPKVATAGRDARDLYMASVFYANQNLTDGFIPEGVIRMIAADAGIASHNKAVKALVSVVMWEEVEGGYQIHDYLDYQQSAEQITVSRESNAKRQEEYRRRKRNATSNGVTNGTDNGPVTDPPTPIKKPSSFSDEKEPPKPPSAKSAEPTAPNGTEVVDHPFVMLEAMCESLGVDVADLTKPEKNKQLAVAKRMADSGVTANDVGLIARWLKSQEWRTSGVDMFTVEKERSKWVTAGKPDGSAQVPKRKPPANLQTNKERNDKSVWLGDWPEYTG